MAYKIVLGIVAALMILNAGLLFDMQRTRAVATRVAEEAAKPAEITFTLIKPKDCKECFDGATFLTALTDNKGIRITTQSILTLGEDKANTSIAQYAITRLPAVVLEGETAKALEKFPGLSGVGTLQDKIFVATKFPPPYFDLATKNVKGLLNITYIKASSCKDCYDVTLHKLAMGNLGITPSQETTVSQGTTAGDTLISLYRIQKLPTVVLTGDMEDYAILKQIWPQVGSIAKDGAYVFTATESMGTYYDVKSKKIVKPQQK